MVVQILNHFNQWAQLIISETTQIYHRASSILNHTSHAVYRKSSTRYSFFGGHVDEYHSQKQNFDLLEHITVFYCSTIHRLWAFAPCNLAVLWELVSKSPLCVNPLHSLCNVVPCALFFLKFLAKEPKITLCSNSYLETKQFSFISLKTTAVFVCQTISSAGNSGVSNLYFGSSAIYKS